MADVKDKENLEELENDDNQDITDSTGADNNEGEDDSNNSKGVSGTGKKERTFSQDQVNKMMTREKNQGRSAALKELGIDPKDSKMVAMVKAMIEAQKSDEQKKLEEQQVNDTALKEAQDRAAIAEAKAEAMQLGVKSQYVEDATTLALSKMSDDTDLKTILGEFKTKYPIWFEESGEDENKSIGKRGTGASVKSKGSKEGKGATSMGARLAAQRKTNKGTKSYWSR